MKATIELPDDLYRRVKAKSALLGRPVRAISEELFRRWLDEGSGASRVTPDHPAERWLEDWFLLSDAAFAQASPGSTAREMLEQDRNRLEQ